MAGVSPISIARTIEQKLNLALAPSHLRVVDESRLHAGHAGAGAGGETHFRVELVSARFEGLSRLQRQREVHRVLSAELAGPVHALSLRLLTPDEVAARPGEPQP